MIEPNAMLNPDERAQFVEAFEDNLDLLLDLVEAVRSESANAEDEQSAEFMTGVLQIVRAFRSSHQAGGPNELAHTERLWSSEQLRLLRVDRREHTNRRRARISADRG
jgi:hypothetical protein